MPVTDFNHFGGEHHESAALKNLMGHAGAKNPHTGQPFSEALCFGIAGGIGAGYSFCPSVIRHGQGSGVAVVGRHKIYATDASWYKGFFDRIGAATRVTETAGAGKAYQNLAAELEAGRPAVVWCSQLDLPFLGGGNYSNGLWMYTFVVYALDEAKGLAYGSDRAAVRVSLTLEELEKARGRICSHKYRTLTFDPPKTLTPATLQSAVRDGMRACAKEMLDGRMKTFSLPGLENWAKMITNGTNKDGWGKVFKDSLLYCALRDVFASIVTESTGGCLLRGLYADFLNEAASILSDAAPADLAQTYRGLARSWIELADAALPDRIKPFKQTKDLLRKKCQLIEEKGEKGIKQVAETTEKLRTLEAETRAAFPLKSEASGTLLEELRGRIVDLHARETAAAKRLGELAGN